VPARYTIGQPGQGFIYQMQQFQEERLWAGAGTLMGCDRIINATIDYTRERLVFGKPLLDNQVIHFRLAELKSEVEALRSLVYRACEDYLAGQDVTMLASMAKLRPAACVARSPTPACNIGAGPAISGTARWRAATATAASARSAAAPTR